MVRNYELFSYAVCLFVPRSALCVCLELRSRREMPITPYAMNDMKRLIFTNLLTNLPLKDFQGGVGDGWVGKS